MPPSTTPRAADNADQIAVQMNLMIRSSGL
jgi:hypothetical protein